MSRLEIFGDTQFPVSIGLGPLFLNPGFFELPDLSPLDRADGFSSVILRSFRGVLPVSLRYRLLPYDNRRCHKLHRREHPLKRFLPEPPSFES